MNVIDRQSAAAAAAATDTVVPLRWHDVAAYGTPCSDRTVLCAAGDEWFSAWWSVEVAAWIECASGGAVEVEPTHWAEPCVPQNAQVQAGPTAARPGAAQ
jgi:hypothetical protein